MITSNNTFYVIVFMTYLVYVLVFLVPRNTRPLTHNIIELNDAFCRL